MSRLTRPMLFASADECEQAFYEALEAADIDAINDLWLDDDDVCCIHPNGPRLVGINAVRQSWAAILANGAVNIRATGCRAIETPTITVHNVVEQVLMTQGRRQQIVQVVATNAYVKTPAGWKMVLHHAAPVPDGKAEDVETPSGPLH